MEHQAARWTTKAFRRHLQLLFRLPLRQRLTGTHLASNDASGGKLTTNDLFFANDNGYHPNQSMGMKLIDRARGGAMVQFSTGSKGYRGIYSIGSLTTGCGGSIVGPRGLNAQRWQGAPLFCECLMNLGLFSAFFCKRIPIGWMRQSCDLKVVRIFGEWKSCDFLSSDSSRGLLGKIAREVSTVQQFRQNLKLWKGHTSCERWDFWEKIKY